MYIFPPVNMRLHRHRARPYATDPCMHTHILAFKYTHIHNQHMHRPFRQGSIRPSYPPLPLPPLKMLPMSQVGLVPVSVDSHVHSQV